MVLLACFAGRHPRETSSSRPGPCTRVRNRVAKDIAPLSPDVIVSGAAEAKLAFERAGAIPLTRSCVMAPNPGPREQIGFVPERVAELPSRPGRRIGCRRPARDSRSRHHRCLGLGGFAALP